MATIRREIISSQPQMPVAQSVPTSLPSYEGGEEKNKGGLIGGVGYLGEKVAVGAVQSIEGIFDYTLGGVAKLFGFDKFAERQFANDWFGSWYDHPDEWFNPGKGWQVAGDIAGGIGTSLPTLAVGLGTGGAGLAMFGVAGLSAAGNATKEAYRETGKLGGREFAYGALTGALEGGIETLTNLVGMGTGAVIKSFGKSLGKEFTESALRQGVGITLAKAFGGEAVEEGVAEIMSSRFKRWTYDSDAEHASAGQILYASFVGGMSGVIMGGAGTVFSTAQNISRGTQIVEAGQADAVIEHAKYISEKAKKGGIEVGAMKQVEATYNKLVKSLEKTGGEVKTVAQRQMLGELKIDNIAAELSPPMYKTVAAIAKDPDTFVEKLNAYGYTDASGNVRTVTKEQLMKGLDVNNLKGTIPTALETNETLRDIVLMSMAGEMMINTSKFQESILRGEKFAGDADLENFLRVASPEEVKSVEKLFGIKDLRTVDAETFNERVAAFEASGQYDEYLARYNAEKTASAEEVNTEDNANIEQNTANPTEESTVDNERRALPEEEESTSASSTGEETEQNTSPSSDGDVMMTLVDSMKFAKENVPEYKSLNADDQAKIRRLIRQAKANGFTDAQTRAYARVSARSGIDIVIGKEGLYLGKTETGADKYSDGVYSSEKNKIIIDPEGTRSPARVLMHELTHAIYKAEEIGKDGKRKIKLILEEGAKKLSDDEKTRIIAKYFKNKKFDPVEYTDELNAHYVEAMLDDEALLEKLCEDNPTLPDKILSFFKKAITGYSDEPTLSREAKKLYKRYKTYFEMFAEKNQYGDVKKQGEERYAYAGEKAKTADKLKLETAKNMLDEGVDSETVRKETGWFKGYDGKWRFEIDDSDMRYSKNGFNPDYLRYKELELKFIEGKISNAELQELRNISEDIKKIALHRLDQFIKHDVLFEAYPELKSLEISFDSSIEGKGAFSSDNFSITINPNNKNIKKTLLHEIQHAIQDIEGFASGGNLDSNQEAVKEVMDIMELTDEQKQIATLDMLAKHSDIVKRPIYDKLLSISKRNGYDTVKEYIYSLNKGDYYERLAGEIEARDTANRADLTAEQRKNIRPDIDRTDVVFAENSLISKDFAGWTADGNEVYHTSPSIMSMSDSNRKAKFFSDFTNAFRGRTAKFVRNGHTHYARFGETKSELGKFVYEGNDPSSKSSAAGYKAKIRLLADGDIFELVEDSSYDNTEPEIGKNKKSHKNAKHWDYYIKTIVVDGKAYDVLINIRNDVIQNDYSTKEEYVYSIRFRDNKKATTSLVHPATSKATSQLDVATDNSISQNPEKSTKTSKKVSTNSGDRMALPDEEVNELDMSSSVGKKRQEYKASYKERVFTVADSVYIDTVDEYYGAEKYLRKIGKKKNAASILQAIRASMSAAQVMIGDVQKDIFSEDGKTLGEGLSKIVKPITVKGDTIKRTFNEYLMHHLNVDRMSLEEKSLAKLDEESLAQLEEIKAKLEDNEQKVRELNEKIAELKDKKKSIFGDEEAQKQIDQRIAKYQREAKALKADILEQKKQIDNFEIMKNKPVFGKNDNRAEAITAEQSLKRIAELEKAHPDFREIAEKVWAYTKNLNHMRVEAGLISAESEAYMNELYPHYVPAYRDTNGGAAAAIKGRRNLAISSTVKSAKGSGLDILDVMDSIAAQTQEVIRAGRINQLFRTIYDTAMLGNGTEYVEIVSREKVSGKQVADESAEGEMPNTIELRPKNNQVTGFVNGEKVTLSVSDEIFIAFDSMSKPTVDPTSAIGKGLQKLNDIYKRLITSWSPAFLLRNPIRDIQDAGLNSKHPIEFAKNFVKVYKMMLENSEEWQTYRAYGGYSASIFGPDGFSADVDSRGFEAMAKLFDTDAPTMKDFFEAAKRGGKNLLTGINNVNAFVEQATRFAEYLASVEAGDSIPNAINNAAEVTTNFGRRGRVTKVLNATIMPFLNPAVQGFDKMFRNVGDAFKEGSGAAIAKALGVLFAKAAAIGLAPMVINMLMYGDDEDYKQLREEDKENNFLIKVGDTFIKIPRGRVASVIGGTANRASKLARGEDADLKGYAENVLSQVTPVGNLTRTIFSPFFDVKNNRTWYGTEIEGRQWDNTAPKDRYDESTSSIAVAIGKVTNYSPKKIHYLLDQYSGVIGDFVLPATSKKATKDFLSGNFTIDAATSNKLSSQFYEMYDKAQYAKTAGDDTAIYQVKYLNSVKDAVSKLHDEKQAIQNDSELSNVEKLQKTRVVQILINEAYKTALADIERYTQAFEATAGIEKTATFQSAFSTSATDATIQKMRYTEATRYMYGAKKALEEYDDKVYEKCELLNSAGVDYDKLYYYYFSTKGLTSDVDKKGNAVSGSKRKKVVATINALDIPSVQKALLICAQGYTLQSGDVKGVTEKKLLSYILKLNTSKEVKENLAKLCGFEVKNGKIVIK